MDFTWVQSLRGMQVETSCEAPVRHFTVPVTLNGKMVYGIGTQVFWCKVGAPSRLQVAYRKGLSGVDFPAPNMGGADPGGH